MSDIEKSLTITAPLDRVWAALTDPVAIGEWMFDDTVEVDLRVGGVNVGWRNQRDLHADPTRRVSSNIPGGKLNGRMPGGISRALGTSTGWHGYPAAFDAQSFPE